MSGDIFETVYVPIADPADAEETARAIQHYADDDSEVIVSHVVEKAGGAPDKLSVEQRERYAEEVYETFLETLPENWGTLRFETLYGRDVGETISEGAVDAGATVVAFTPRGGARWARLVSGDVARTLIDNTRIPVVALPKLPERILLD